MSVTIDNEVLKACLQLSRQNAGQLSQLVELYSRQQRVKKEVIVIDLTGDDDVKNEEEVQPSNMEHHRPVNEMELDDVNSMETEDAWFTDRDQTLDPRNLDVPTLRDEFGQSQLDQTSAETPTDPFQDHAREQTPHVHHLQQGPLHPVDGHLHPLLGLEPYDAFPAQNRQNNYNAYCGYINSIILPVLDQTFLLSKVRYLEANCSNGDLTGVFFDGIKRAVTGNAQRREKLNMLLGAQYREGLRVAEKHGMARLSDIVDGLFRNVPAHLRPYKPSSNGDIRLAAFYEGISLPFLSGELWLEHLAVYEGFVRLGLERNKLKGLARIFWRAVTWAYKELIELALEGLGVVVIPLCADAGTSPLADFEDRVTKDTGGAFHWAMFMEREPARSWKVLNIRITDPLALPAVPLPTFTAFTIFDSDANPDAYPPSLTLPGRRLWSSRHWGRGDFYLTKDEDHLLEWASLEHSGNAGLAEVLGDTSGDDLEDWSEDDSEDAWEDDLREWSGDDMEWVRSRSSGRLCRNLRERLGSVVVAYCATTAALKYV
ncbi:hypothetical protein HDV00_000905 [Rhizophlyctis rosea]|nr:hypothetical protein HDV00_000905 [Rhizophlyctis rosea]